MRQRRQCHLPGGGIHQAIAQASQRGQPTQPQPPATWAAPNNSEAAISAGKGSTRFSSQRCRP
jgi:hypothetical protein